MPAARCGMVPQCTAGRRPRGLSEASPGIVGSTPAGWLARASALEAASVDAFRELSRELRRFGAPRRLVRAAQRAARDERRHARRVRALAARAGWRGGSTPAPTAPSAAPDLEAFATHKQAREIEFLGFGFNVYKSGVSFTDKGFLELSECMSEPECVVVFRKIGFDKGT